MRVAFVTDTFPPDLNGVALTVERWTRGLRERGHDVSVFRPHPATAGEPGTDEHRVPSLPLPGYPEVRFGLPSLRRLWRHFSTRRPDVIYVATEGLLGFSATRLARVLGIPVVSGFHTNFHQYLAQHRLPRLGAMAWRYMRRLHNGTAATLAPSRQVAGELRASGFRNIELLSRGVDTTLFSPVRRSAALRAEWGVPGDDAPVFLLAGRVAREKNLPLALEALEALHAAGHAVHCVVVGDGPDRAELQARFGFARFTGALRGETLARHCASADVLLFPSLTETFGNVVLEAMASGLLVVAFDRAAAHEHVVDGINGWKVPVGDLAGYRQRIRRALFCAAGSRRALGAAARRTTETLGWDEIVARFEHLLTGAAAAARPSPEPVPT